ncbi:hypothetical protein MKW94_013120, partial [Papaver nudicaule]|nr:hypothetical protein [Papaver nudicaule]
MGVSFKVAKTGTRFRPKLIQSDDFLDDDDEDNNNNESTAAQSITSTRKPKGDVGEAAVAGISGSSSCSGGLILSAASEVSFTLDLYQDGYLIRKPTEDSVQVSRNSLRPYDRTSEAVFSAIESGRLPRDILDDIPSKYLNGTLVCEVRDYRKRPSEPGNVVSSMEQLPVINKVSLRMSLENVVKDIPLISDDSWTYSDLMEVESRILKALQPQLCLDPTPMLERLCSDPVPTKLNLGLSGRQKRKCKQMPEVTVMSNNQTHGKKVFIDRSGDSATIFGDATQRVLENANSHISSSSHFRPKSVGSESSSPANPMLPNQSKYQQGFGYQKMMQDQISGPVVNASGVLPSSGDLMMSYSDTMNGAVSSLGKREFQDTQLATAPLINKRARQIPTGLDAISQQGMGSQLDTIPGTDVFWKNTLHQQAESRGLPYANAGLRKLPQKVLEGVPNQDAFYSDQQGMGYVIKKERMETEKFDKPEFDRNKIGSHAMEMENNQLDMQQGRINQRIPPHPTMRSHFPAQMQWNNLGQLADKDLRKDDQFQKRKQVQSPRVSSGPMVQSPVSSKSGEFSSGSLGPQLGVAASAYGVSQKPTGPSAATIGGIPSMASSPSDSMQRQYQAPTAPKRKSNSVPKSQAMSGVGSPASVSNMSVPLNANSPSVSTPPLADQSILDRFAKIEMVAQRHQLNCKKNKVDNIPSKEPVSYSTQHLQMRLSNVSNYEDFKDSSCVTPLSKSLIGGSMNVCKRRALEFSQGYVVSIIHRRNRLILSEKHDGTVAIQYGDIDDNELQVSEEYMPSLPNTNYADLLAAQFCSL